MSRVFRSESGSRTRTRLLQTVALALRGTAVGELKPESQKDVMAFIALALQEVSRSVDASAIAWEKRGYWVKADRFRAEWDWVDAVVKEMGEALAGGDWHAAAGTAGLVAGHVARMKLPARIPRSRPWEGAWERWAADRG